MDECPECGAPVVTLAHAGQGDHAWPHCTECDWRGEP